MKKKVNLHGSIIILESKDKKEFLFNVYDNEYPFKEYRESPHLFGGQFEEGDETPWEILAREILEELLFKSDSDNVASTKDRAMITNAILGNAIPLQDFHVIYNNIWIHNANISCYQATLPPAVFECAKRNISNGKILASEGLTCILTQEELFSGKPMAWCNPPILSQYLNKKIPNPYDVEAIPLGFPRDSLSDYLADFEYVGIEIR